MLKKRAIWIFDEMYKVPTYLSVASFRAHLDIPITLFYCGAHLTEEDAQEFKKFGGKIEIINFNNKTEARIQDHIKAHWVNRMARMYAMQCWPQEMVLIMDSDLLFSKQIEGIIPDIETSFYKTNTNDAIIWGVKELDRAHENSFFTEKMEESGDRVRPPRAVLQQCYADVYGNNWAELLGGIQYNNGLLGVYNGQELAKSWKAHYLKGCQNSQVNIEDDQLPLSVAIKTTNTVALELDKKYNSFGLISGDFAVYHAWRRNWLKEIDKIENGDSTLEDYGKIAKPHYFKMPRRWLLEKQYLKNYSS